MGPGPRTLFRIRKKVNYNAFSTNVFFFFLQSPYFPTHVHGQYTAGDEFTVLSDAKVPRLYPHHVVKHELQVQAALYTNLVRAQGFN